MAVALAVLQERLDVVIVEPWFVPHVGGLNGERTTARLVVDTQQCRPQQIIEGVPERSSPGQTLPFNARHHIVIQRNSGSDAHDVLSLASTASARFVPGPSEVLACIRWITSGSDALMRLMLNLVHHEHQNHRYSG